MYFPVLQGHSNEKSTINSFGGLNLSQEFSVGEFSKMNNMTSDKFPFVAPSVKKDRVQINSNIQNIQGVISPGDDSLELSGFTGVADGKFYYQDKIIPFAYGFMEIPKDRNVEVLHYADTIVITPCMYCYEYKNADKNKKVYPLVPGVYDRYISAYSDGAKDQPVTFKLDTSTPTWEEFGFKVGDSIVVKCTKEGFSKLNVYEAESKYDIGTYSTRVVRAEIISLSGLEMKVNMYNYNNKILGITQDSGGEEISEQFKSSEMWIYKRFPFIENATVHANRIWATTTDGESIYATMPGKPGEFLNFRGLSTDSWYTEVGETGKFTGITSFRDGVIAFKKNKIYHVFGDRPTNFSIAKSFSNCGCVDAKSVCETDSAVYFLGADGVYEYSGGNPVNISKKLDLKNCSGGQAFSDGRKYYISLSGEEKLYAYDRTNGLWHIEGDFQIMGGMKFDDFVYFLLSGSILKMTDIYENKWSAVLCDITENDMRHKGMNDIFIRVENGENSYVEVSCSVNGEEFKTYGKTSEAGDFTFRVPVRFKKGDKYSIKISGEGSAVIKAIERRFYIGGRAFTRKG